MTIDRDRLLTTLRAKRSEIEADYGVRLMGIVGSVARGEERPESDVDVVADIIRTPSLFELSRAERTLQAAVGRPVDLVLREAMRPAARALIERDLIPL